MLTLEEIRALPEPQPLEGGVYFLWLAGELVYVGRSRNVLWRLEIIRSNTRYAKVAFYSMPMPFDRVTLLKLDLAPEVFHYVAKDYEHAYIATLMPEYNADYMAAGNWS